MSGCRPRCLASDVCEAHRYDLPFMRPTERASRVPRLARQHLHHLLRHEATGRDSVPGHVPSSGTAREHPAAVVKRQQERDVAVLLPTISHLTERQHQLFFLIHSVIARHKPDALSRLARRGCRPGRGCCRGHAGNRRTRRAVRTHAGVASRAEARQRDYGDDRRGSRARNQDLRWRSWRSRCAPSNGARGTPRNRRPGDTAYISLVGRLLHVRSSVICRRDRQAREFADSALTLLQYGVCAPGRRDAGRIRCNIPRGTVVPVP